MVLLYSNNICELSESSAEDEVSSDVKGASALGIRTLWLNRFGKDVPDGVTDIKDHLEAFNSLV